MKNNRIYFRSTWWLIKYNYLDLHINKQTKTQKMTSITDQLENHFINFMMNDANEDTFTFEKLWEIEFHEGGHITLERDQQLWISGDNGRMLLEELTVKNLTAGRQNVD